MSTKTGETEAYTGAANLTSGVKPAGLRSAPSSIVRASRRPAMHLALPRQGPVVRTSQLDSFGDCFAELDDPRAYVTRYELAEILTIALCAVLAGARTVADMAVFAEAKQDFLRSFMRLENGVPGHMTFSRVLGNLDPDQFRSCFQRFTLRLSHNCTGVIESDGNTVHRPTNSTRPGSTSGVGNGGSRSFTSR